MNEDDKLSRPKMKSEKKKWGHKMQKTILLNNINPLGDGGGGGVVDQPMRF